MSEMRRILEKYDTFEQIVTIPAGQQFQAVPADPDRWMFAIGGATVVLFISTITISTAGFNLSGIQIAGGETRVFSYRDWGAFINLQWYGKTTAGPGTFSLFTLTEKR